MHNNIICLSLCNILWELLSSTFFLRACNSSIIINLQKSYYNFDTCRKKNCFWAHAYIYIYSRLWSKVYVSPHSLFSSAQACVAKWFEKRKKKHKEISNILPNEIKITQTHDSNSSKYHICIFWSKRLFFFRVWIYCMMRDVLFFLRVLKSMFEFTIVYARGTCI